MPSLEKTQSSDEGTRICHLEKLRGKTTYNQQDLDMRHPQLPPLFRNCHFKFKSPGGCSAPQRRVPASDSSHS
ncbi:uncharacterized protein G2W53_001097 [Senna tora]|uniref:Uncharacterized protein n=1 Tax=Senna tora TaxID=362788 RepID=A0A834XH62_9FABA|nr:uncharacterized protein G2W53_001097 [Senna tora]